ncbi:hypothetical protein F4801DRAFT_604431 [Xylaria longipes]|nr:hypothetical protein F4801DRAFT_604431 [Xylaria longipes]RYC65774.1 hypothetical protein CHU98_g446 [Xylaria longipes]
MPTQFVVGIFATVSHYLYRIVVVTLAVAAYLVRLGLRGIVFATSGRQNCNSRKNLSYDWIKDWEPNHDIPTESSYSKPPGDPDRPRVESRTWQQLCLTLPDPEVLDFLLACVHAAVQVKDYDPTRVEWFTLPRTFPLQPSAVHEVIDSFPPLNHTSTISDLIGDENQRHERYTILKWLDLCFRRQIIPVEGVLHVPEIPSSKQFIQLSSRTLHQVGFMSLMKIRCLESGRAGFHGTPAINLLNILYEGLTARVDTVSYASHPELAIQYIHYKGAYYNDVSPGIMKGWKNSAFKNVVVLLGVEIARKDIEWIPFDRYYSGKCFQGEIAVRYLFVMPRGVLQSSVKKHGKGIRGTVIPHGSQARASMEDVYQYIRRGD